MRKNNTLTFQMIVIGGFIFFFYMFFALATSIYRDYKLESEIQKFEADINNLADLANTKPEDVEYFASVEYKDRYAKENLNLLNPGEKLIIIPEEDRVVEKGAVNLMTDKKGSASVLGMSNPQQWREYFFGQTLSVKVPSPVSVPKVEPFEDRVVEPVEG
ncbi:septum formation initiator family protein [Candidatus Peregrinibacteria bacterium]|nr:septum formation initiator family protein [Candidatus Peregrinibacteria bacterium]